MRRTWSLPRWLEPDLQNRPERVKAALLFGPSLLAASPARLIMPRFTGCSCMQFVEAHGASIPAIGLGTWELRGRACTRLVEQAIRLGYRHIDTAQIYENEREVGEGLRASRIRRDEVFVTTKVWTTHFAPYDLERSTKESLTKLRSEERR